MKILLARHGQTALNRARKFYGSTDVSINNQGIKEAKELAVRLQSKQMTKVYTSTLKRTKETANWIVRQNNWDVLPIEIAAFNEKNMGIWEGLDADEIEVLDPITWEHFLKSPFTTTPKEAESFQHFCLRIEEGFQKISTSWQCEDEILIVGHQGVLRHLARRFLGEQRSYFDIEFKQGCVYEYEWQHDE